MVQFQRLSATLGEAEGEREWTRTRTFKLHTHDVRAVLELQRVIVSGGQCAVAPCCPGGVEKSPGG